jgi:general secretion pathway protein L
MTEFVLLRLDANLQPTQWVQLSARNKSQARAIGEVQSIDSLQINAATKLPVIAITASPRLCVRFVTAPQKGLEKFRAAVSFALEDQVASDIDELQFALPQEIQAGSVPVAVIAKSDVELASSQCQRAGFPLSALIPESWLLDVGTAMLERQQTSFRFANDILGSLETDNLAALLRIKQSKDGALPLTFLHAADMAMPALPSHIQSQSIANPMRYFAERLLQQKSLLTAIQPSTGGARSSLWRMPAWRQATWAAMAASVLWMLGLGFEHWQLKSTLAHQEQEIAQMFDRMFPNQPLALDPLGRVQSALKTDSGVGATQSGWRLLRQIAPVLVSETKLTLQNLSYRGQALDLSFRSPDLASLESARARIGALVNIQATMGSNVVDPDGRMLTGHVLVNIKAPAGSTTTPGIAP